MLTVILLTNDATAAEMIGHMAEQLGSLNIAMLGYPMPEAEEVVRAIRCTDPHVILVDASDWSAIASLAARIAREQNVGVRIAFASTWTALDRGRAEDAGFHAILTAPFTAGELEATVYAALRDATPAVFGNLFAFLPAKAGGGCSTVALNVAGALARQGESKVLMIDADRRSGVIGTLLNLDHQTGVAGALEQASSLTPLKWNEFYAKAAGMDLLLADPAKPGRVPTWADYYLLLRFVEPRYTFVVADLPEVVNPATSEVVRSAQSVFVVCTPEVLSLRLAAQRCAELETCGLPPGRVHILVNRWEKQVPIADIEATLARPVYATLPNDYAGIRRAVLNSSLVDPSSRFQEGCVALARKLARTPEAPPSAGKLHLLRRLSRIASY
ncbi:MAG: hypothetical protein K2X35_19660 [Bryobacteraceae bacterium]|nr:hypothetical protein [Bryobacteraceae bacterium]